MLLSFYGTDQHKVVQFCEVKQKIKKKQGFQIFGKNQSESLDPLLWLL